MPEKAVVFTVDVVGLYPCISHESLVAIREALGSGVNPGVATDTQYALGLHLWFTTKITLTLMIR